MFQNENLLDYIVCSRYESLKNPEKHQKLVLERLVSQYSKTRYGQTHNASQIRDLADFRHAFPVVNYNALNPYFTEVIKGEYSAILSEPVLCWVMTGGVYWQGKGSSSNQKPILNKSLFVRRSVGKLCFEKAEF
jgi:hypothetical protein